MRFNGIVFPHQIRKVCLRLQAITKTNPNIETVTVTLNSEEKSEPFSHKQVIKKVYITKEDNDKDASDVSLSTARFRILYNE
jgi:hypothetical protein